MLQGRIFDEDLERKQKAKDLTMKQAKEEAREKNEVNKWLATCQTS